MTLIEQIPVDPKIVEYDLKGIPLFDLPEDSPAFEAVGRLFRKLKI